MDIKNTPIGLLTVEQFIGLINPYLVAHAPPTFIADNSPHMLHGVSELAVFLGVSLSTAQRIKGTGILIPATAQLGRTCVFDADKVMELLQSRSAVIKYKKKKT